MMIKYIILAVLVASALSVAVPASADKAPPVSAPLPTPTPITIGKGEYGGTFGQPVAGNGPDEAAGGVKDDSSEGGEDGLHWHSVDIGAPGWGEHDVAMRVDSVSTVPLARSVLWPEPVYPKLTFVYRDDSQAQLREPEFARTHLSVMEGESGGNNSYRITNVAGVDYEVIGCMQLLQDTGMIRLRNRLGRTREDLFVCGKNVLLAEAWWVEASNRTWRLWVVKPKWSLP